MDLDNIKKEWQNIHPTFAINDDKIRKMLDNTKKGAFNALLRYEKLCILVLFLMFPLVLFFQNTIVSRFLFISLIFILIWQSYRYNLLRKTDFANMGVVEISTRIAKYRKLISYGLVLGIIWLLIYLPVYCFFMIHENKSISYGKYISNEVQAMVLFCVLTILLSAILLWLVYKKIIMKNIRSIESILKEVQEFEEGNKE